MAYKADSNCVGCGICASQCRYDAITVNSGHADVDYSKCQDCGHCESVCPMNAIHKD
jgi:heterodisulfide reductase subunit A-like polyferredoxin